MSKVVKRETVVVVPVQYDEDGKRIGGGIVKVIIRRTNGEKIVGVAKCMENDKFDPAFGEELARIRARRKVALRRMRECNKDLDNLEKVSSAIAEPILTRLSRARSDATDLTSVENALLAVVHTES